MRRRALLGGLSALLAPALPSPAKAEHGLGWTISTNPEHPGYSTWAWLHSHGMTVKDVYCDGVKLVGCATACQKEGYAICATYDADGDIIFDRVNNRFPERVLRGKIDFEFKEYSRVYFDDDAVCRAISEVQAYRFNSNEIPL